MQPTLLDALDRERSRRLMEAMDTVNARMGRRGTLAPAAAVVGKGWRMRQDSRSPHYTTSLDDIPVVKA